MQSPSETGKPLGSLKQRNLMGCVVNEFSISTSWCKRGCSLIGLRTWPSSLLSSSFITLIKSKRTQKIHSNLQDKHSRKNKLLERNRMNPKDSLNPHPTESMLAASVTQNHHFPDACLMTDLYNSLWGHQSDHTSGVKWVQAPSPISSFFGERLAAVTTPTNANSNSRNSTQIQL